jgi:hypothetical protein
MAENNFVFSTNKIAEIIWKSEYRRATGKERTVPWSEVPRSDKRRYEFIAFDIVSYVDDIIDQAS